MRLLSSLTNRIFGAMALEAWDGGFAVYAGDSDGQVFESRDGGRHGQECGRSPRKNSSRHRSLRSVRQQRKASASGRAST